MSGSKPKIRLLMPCRSNEFLTPELYASTMQRICAGIDAQLSFRFVEDGPDSIETTEDEEKAVPGLVKLAKAAEKEGIDGLVVDCMGDPGVEEITASVGIPIFGPARTCMHYALMQSNRVEIIASSAEIVPLFEKQVLDAGLSLEMFSVGHIETAVLDIWDNKETIVGSLADLADEVLKENPATQIMLGCTGFTELADGMVRTMSAKNAAARVINPTPTTVRQMAAVLSRRDG